MKRDMDLARAILFALEDVPSYGDLVELSFSDYSQNEVSYHVMLLHEAGLIHALDTSTAESSDWQPMYLTWEGHEFLEAAKDDTRWNRAKNHFKQKGVPMVFDVFKSLLVSYAKQAVFGPADS